MVWLGPGLYFRCSYSARLPWGLVLPRMRDPFGSVLRALRSRLADGVYAPGEALAIVELAQEFEFSTTPIREALGWLAGEQVIEERRGAGFSCWRVEYDLLLSLYDLHEAYVRLALQSLGARRDLGVLIEGGEAPAGAEPIRQAARTFRSLVAASGNMPLFQAHGALTVRLGNIRRAENAVLLDQHGELAAFEAVDWNCEALSAWTTRYHKVRRDHAAETLKHMASGQIYSRI